MAGKIQIELIREYLGTGRSLNKENAKAILGIKNTTGIHNHISRLRSEGYIITVNNGTYTMIGYNPPKRESKDKKQAQYIAARQKLIPEAEIFAGKHAEPGTEDWTYMFATKMAELARERLGCKTSWQE